ncbi:unnamed protein product [Mesocestoides corti]|uniref:JmjC domain-containing protein n=1 Tax=Mesocestoides corti TaxID=53468 RepID=A0A0R3UJE1_MESCO|nr:unnamed protein product [Mesocestoides corti]
MAELLQYVGENNRSPSYLIGFFERLIGKEDDVFVRACLETLQENKPDFYPLTEYVREKLNTGYWRDVPEFWREAYSLLRYASVLSCLSIPSAAEEYDAEYILWQLDDALIMGHSDDVCECITKLASLVNAFLVDSLPSMDFPTHYSDVNAVTPDLTTLTFPDEVISELQRIHQPSLTEFTDILAAGIPVIITGAMSHWPACDEASDHYWSPAYWSRTAGYRTVPVEIGSAYTDESWGQRLITVNRFFETFVLRTSKSQPVGYLAQHQILLQIPELALDVDIPEYCYAGLSESPSEEAAIDSNIWVGPANTVSPLHHDSDRANVLCQLIGQKYVKLYNADQTEFVYPHTENSMLSNTSQVDVANQTPDFNKFPKFAQARGYHGVLRKGEMLFIPPRAWHYIRSLTTSISMNFWWNVADSFIPPWPESYKILRKMSHTKSTQDTAMDLEQQFLLRMPEEAARYLAEDIDLGIPFKDNFTIEMKPDMRHSIVRYNGQVYHGRMMDLPCIIESLKTTDRKTFYKTADISQMMICTQDADDDGTAPIRGSAAFLAAKSSHNRPQPTSVYGFDLTNARSLSPDECSSQLVSHSFCCRRDNREFQYLHGMTPPLKNVLRRRFRKTRKKRSVDMSQIEKEVKNLLRADLEADSVTWEIIWSDPPKPAESSASGAVSVAGGDGDVVSGRENLPSSGLDGRKASTDNASGTLPLSNSDDEESDNGADHRSLVVDNLFGVISSSSDESEASDSEAQTNSDLDEAPPSKEAAKTAGKQPAHPLPPSPSSPIDHLGQRLKTTDLAAELLLSDSGDDSDDDDDEDRKTHRGGSLYPLQSASDAAAAAGIEVLNEVIDEVGLVDDGLDDDDDDDDFVPAGGELLADDESAAVYHHEPIISDNEDVDMF